MVEDRYVAEVEQQLGEWKATLGDLGVRAREQSAAVTAGISYPEIVENLTARMKQLEQKLQEIRVAEDALLDSSRERTELDEKREDFERLYNYLKNSLEG